MCVESAIIEEISYLQHNDNMPVIVTRKTGYSEGTYISTLPQVEQDSRVIHLEDKARLIIKGL